MNLTRAVFVPALLLLAGCRPDPGGATTGNAGGDPAGSRDRIPPATAAIETEVELPDGPWRDLARRLVSADSLADSVEATREVLARGGVATHDGERVLVAARGPAATFTVSPRESLLLAMEARRRPNTGRLTIEELAQMLEGFGFPFPDADPDGRAHGAVDRLQAGDAPREDAGAADDAAREAQRARALAADEALVARLRATTERWQLARQAASRAAPAERPAKQADVDRIWNERQALIAERRDAQLQARTEQDALRDRLAAERELARRMQQVQQRIGADPVNGERLMALLDAWVREAAKAPGDPRNFTPLFLAEMARLQDAPVDLTGSAWTRPGRGAGAPVDLRGAPRARQLRWTLLELELFGAAFQRRDARSAALSAPLRRFGARLADALVPPAHASDACIEYKETYGETWGEIASAAGGWGVGQALDRGIGAAVDGAAAEAFGKAMNAIGIATKLAKLASFYADSQVYVEPEPRSLHKPAGGNEMVMYVARVGLDEEAMEEYERQLREVSKADRMARDCLNSLGLPARSDLVDMTEEAEKWLVEWEVHDGQGTHVVQAASPPNTWYLPGRRAMSLRRESATSLRAELFVEVFPEEKHSGKVVRAYATAEASVDAAGMPSLGTFVTGAAGGLGLAEALVDLFGGWFQYMNMPKAYGTIEIEYHCPKPTTLHRTGKPVADGGGDDGPSECLIAAGKG